MVIIIDLTEKELAKLEEIAIWYYDEGPLNEGWKSLELESLSDKILNEINKIDKINK